MQGNYSMKPTELQPGQYSLNQGDIIVVKSKGISTQFAMLINGGFDVVHERLGSENALAYKVFFKFADDITMMQGNLVMFNVDNLAKYFNLSKGVIYRSLHVLLKADLLRKVKKGCCIMNPNIIWNGKTADRLEAIIAWEGNE